MGKIKNVVKGYVPDRVWQILRLIFNPKRPKKKLRVEIHIADHCNLNCRGCDNFSCIAKPNFLDMEVYKKDILRLREIFGDDVEWITMMGGETLLNENVTDFCHFAREVFPQALIRIITNGTLLLKRTEKFWKDLKRDDVLLYVTKYPINFDYDAAKKYAEEKGVKWEYSFESGDVLKTMYFTPIDLKGEQNPSLSYQLCGKGNKCITLKEGKLYTCETIPNFFTFNDFFGTDLQVTEEDYIDIYECSDPKEIMKKMASYAPACRYCDNLHYCSGIEWGVTEKKITEWVKK